MPQMQLPQKRASGGCNGLLLVSNHFHALLQDPEGELANFMGYFQGNLCSATIKIPHAAGDEVTGNR